MASAFHPFYATLWNDDKLEGASFEGDPKHVDDKDIDAAKGQGRKIVVTFTDGETICGFTAGYSKEKQGFFVIPVDQKANNARVFVVAEAVKKVE